MNQKPSFANLTPRDRFQQSGTRISDHRAMVGSPIFEWAADAALLEYANMVSRATTSTEAMGAGLKVQGAIEFLKILKTLAEPAAQITPVKPLGLDPAN